MLHAAGLRSTILLFLFLVVLTLPTGSNGQGDAGSKAGEMRGRVIDDATGSPVAGIPVSLLDRSTVTNSLGRFGFSDVPVERDTHLRLGITNAGGQVIGCNIISVPVRFYPIPAALGNQVDVAIASPAERREVELRVVEVEGTHVTEFCAECHKANPCTGMSNYGEEMTAANKLGGIAVREDEVDALKERLTQQGLVEDAYAGIRYQDAHPQKIDMDQIANTKDAAYDGRYRFPTHRRVCLKSREPTAKAAEAVQIRASFR